MEKYGQIRADQLDEFSAAIENRYFSDADKQLLFNSLQKVRYSGR